MHVSKECDVKFQIYFKRRQTDTTIVHLAYRQKSSLLPQENNNIT